MDSDNCFSLAMNSEIQKHVLNNSYCNVTGPMTMIYTVTSMIYIFIFIVKIPKIYDQIDLNILNASNLEPLVSIPG